MILASLISRDHFGIFLNECGLIGEGAEIGVDEGRFAYTLLTSWNGRKLYGVDPYTDYPEDQWRDGPHFFPNRADAFGKALCNLLPFGKRHEFRQTTSALAAPSFRDNQLDFAYVDANHCLESVAQDIALWWPKIKPGGLLGGHDFYWRDTPHQLCEVPKAVGLFCQHYSLIEHITSCKSWWVHKER